MRKYSRAIAVVLVLVLALSMCFALSACMPTTGGTAGGTGEEGGLGNYSTIIILVVLVVVFYFFLIRPENKRKKQAAEMKSNLGVGDTITTIGGIVGTIVEIDDGLYTIETSEDQVRLQITQWAISASGVSKGDGRKK